MQLTSPVNRNYAAQVVRVQAVIDLPGLDRLVGIPVLGHRALTTRGVEVGDLRIVFTAETALSEEYARENDLHREPALNKTDTVGYLEKNRRIRALRLRGNRSDALLMPLDSVAFTGVDPSQLQEGDTFDILNGVEVCKKYEVQRNHKQNPAKSKVERAFKRVDKLLFPEHIETDQWWRSKHLLRPGHEVVITQKVHGTSIRVGRVPCLRQKNWLERKLNRWLPTTDHTYDAVFGSRKVIKDVNNPNQDHYYDSDIWTEYGKTIQDLIPEGFIVYAELVGFTPDGAAIQKSYTYTAAATQAELYVYRVAIVNTQGTLADLSWDGVKEFCRDRGLKWCPELARLDVDDVDEFLERIEDIRFADRYHEHANGCWPFTEEPIQLSDRKTVDEGVCIRQEGIVPSILKAKSPAFLRHESALLDKGESDIESSTQEMI